MHDGTDLTALGATELAARVHDGVSCAAEVAEAHLARIAAHPGPSPFVRHDPERVMVEAAAVDTRHDRFALPLAGVPVAVAASIDVSGWATRHGSAAVPDVPARRDDELVRRLRHAGAIVIGSTAVPEFGIGETAGAADAVARRLAALAVDLDGGDGLRVPAARRGLVAAVPGAATVALPGGRDTLWGGLVATGGLARSAADAALLLGVLGLPCTPEPPSLERIAVSLAVPGPPGRRRALDPDQRAAVIGAAARLRAWPGAAVVVLADPPYPRRLGRAWLRRVRAGVAEHIAAVDGIDPSQLGARTAALARRGRRTRPAAADAVWRSRATTWFADGGFDVLLCPAVPRVGPEPCPRHRTVLTRAWSLAGLPTAVVPVVVDGRTAAVQLVGRPGSESTLLAAAALLERRTVPATGAARPRVYA